jgi:hypothetical protein
MWELFEAYERRRTGRESTTSDILLAALAELRRQPLDHPYAAVIAG